MKSSMRRRQEDLQQEEEALQRQRQRILEDLRQQVSDGEAALEVERKAQRAIALEIAELRGRAAHEAKEQREWEETFRSMELQRAEEARAELRRLRLLFPEAAAQYRATHAAHEARALK